MYRISSTSLPIVDAISTGSKILLKMEVCETGDELVLLYIETTPKKGNFMSIFKLYTGFIQEILALI